MYFPFKMAISGAWNAEHIQVGAPSKNKTTKIKNKLEGEKQKTQR